jgi:uncharacterized protein (TIGR01319 family)
VGDIKIFVDFGSTFTKAIAVEIGTASLLSSVQVPSTVERDITTGLNQALRLISHNAGIRELEKKDILACSSARGGLRIVSIGFVAELSSKAATMTALGAGAKIVGHYSYELTVQEMEEIEEISPDIVLLAGGTDGGDRKVIVHNAAMLARSKLNKAHIIIAGNKSAHDEIKIIFSQSGKPVSFTRNIMPEIGKLDTEPCNEQVREIFIRSIVEAKGISRARSIVKDVIMPTPLAVLKAAKLLSEGFAGEEGLGELVVMDPGGATTDVHSITEGKPAKGNVVIKGLPEPYIKRTVEGDLGVRYNMATVLEILRKRNPTGTEAGIYNREMPRADQLPRTDSELDFDNLLASVCIEVAMERHAGIIEEVCGPAGEMFVQRGKDLTRVESVVGTGGPVVFSKDPRQLLERVLFREENPYLLRPKNPRFYLDKHYILFGVGLLAQTDPRAALMLAKHNLSLI